MSNIKRNILGTIAGFSLIFMNNSNVTKSVNQLFENKQRREFKFNIYTCKWYCTGFITRDFFMWNLCIIIFYNQFIERYCFIQE